MRNRSAPFERSGTGRSSRPNPDAGSSSHTETVFDVALEVDRMRFAMGRVPKGPSLIRRLTYVSNHLLSERWMLQRRRNLRLAMRTHLFAFARRFPWQANP